MKLLLLFMTQMLIFTNGQEPKWSWDPFQTVCKPGTCMKDSKTCDCILIVEHRLTMMIDRTSFTDQGSRVFPRGGKLYEYRNNLEPTDQKKTVSFQQTETDRVSL